jgi:hypothetical protein
MTCDACAAAGPPDAETCECEGSCPECLWTLQEAGIAPWAADGNCSGSRDKTRSRITCLFLRACSQSLALCPWCHRRSEQAAGTQ